MKWLLEICVTCRYLEDPASIAIFFPVLSERISMNLTELRDLQSRLMLIAGEAEKGRQDVNRFIAVLSAVEKLTKTYIKLKRSGCLLFTNWKATIR